jgi:hypothetical protein
MYSTRRGREFARFQRRLHACALKSPMIVMMCARPGFADEEDNDVTGSIVCMHKLHQAGHRIALRVDPVIEQLDAECGSHPLLRVFRTANVTVGRSLRIYGIRRNECALDHTSSRPRMRRI